MNHNNAHLKQKVKKKMLVFYHNICYDFVVIKKKKGGNVNGRKNGQDYT